MKKNLYILVLVCCGKILYSNSLVPLCDSVKQISNLFVNYEETHERKADLEEIEKFIDEAASKCSASYIIDVYYELAIYYYFAGNFQKCLETCKKVIDESTQDSTILYYNMNAYNLMANIKGIQNHYHEALRLFGKAKEIALRQKSDFYNGLTANEVMVFISMGRYEEALKNLIEVKKKYEQAGDEENVAVVLSNMGELYREHFDDPRGSLRFYREAIAIDVKRKDNLKLAKVINNVGLAFKNLGEIDSSNYYLRKGLDLCTELGNEISMAKCYYNLAENLEIENNPDQAKEYYQKSVSISAKIDYENGLFYGYMGLSGLCSKQNKINCTLDYITKAEEYKPKSYNKAIEALYFKKKYENLQRLKMYKESNALSEEYYARRDSMEAFQNEEAILKLRADYENELSRKEKARLIAEKEIAEKTLQRKQDQNLFYLVLGIAAFLITILLSIFFVQRGKDISRLRALSHELKERNGALAEAEKRLATESEMKTKILSVLGHDLRAPFASISGLLNVINHNLITLEEVKAMTHQLSIEVEQTLSNLSNILTWSRLQMDSSGVNKEPMNLSLLMSEVEELLKPTARAKQIKLQRDIDESISIVADNNQIRSILTNLTNNAIKFSRKGGEVTLGYKQDENNHYLSVKDTGIGLNKKALKALNQKASYTSLGTSGEKGTGIGLSLVRDFTRLHGGEVIFSNNDPKGTIVEVKLPKDNSTTKAK